MRLIEIAGYRVTLELTVMDCEQMVDLMATAAYGASGREIPEHLATDEVNGLAEALGCFFESAQMAAEVADAKTSRPALSQIRQAKAKYRGVA